MKQGVEGGCTNKDNSIVANVGRGGGGAGQLCSVILSSVSFSGFFPNQSLEKAEAGGVAGRGGTERLVGGPNLLGRTMYPSASLSLTLWCLGVLSGPPHPAKNPLNPTQAPTLQIVSFNWQKKNAMWKIAGAHAKKIVFGRRDTAAGPRFIEKKRGRVKSGERGVDRRQ